MIQIETADYLVRLLDLKNEKELNDVRRLRYRFLLKEFNPNMSDGEGLDDDGYDSFSDSILVIEKSSGLIVGTYRVATDATLKGKKFKSENEFDFSSLKSAPGGIVEAGRAVVHGDYRTGVVIGLLWKALFLYAEEHGLRYIIGTCSLHGTDPSVYAGCTSVLNNKYLCRDFDIRAVSNAFEYGKRHGLNEEDIQIPGLLKAYLRFGAKVSQNGFIDYEFNCCDVMIVLDRQIIDQRMLKYFMR